MSTTDATTEAIVSPQSLASIDAAQAKAIFLQGEEAVAFALLDLAKQLADARSQSVNPATPSGMIPTYQKPPAKGRKKSLGAKPGHQGSRRAVPAQIDHKKVHRAKNCPDCGSRLKQCSKTRTRYTEDIPDTKPETTEHTIHRDWCPQYNKKVEPPVIDALHGSTLGLRVLVLSAWLHFALGNTLGQIVNVLPFDNNHAERSIRPAVIIRKNSYGNRSEQGADCQATMMSNFRTLKQRGHDPIRTIISATQHYLESGKLPPLPQKTTSLG